MLDVRNIRSLSEFQRNTRSHIRRLKRTGKPEVLTVNGRAELVVQDAAAYQKLVDSADLADSVRILREHLAQSPTQDIPAADMLKRVRKKLDLRERK